MESTTCPKCGSTNIKKQVGFAARKYEGQPAQPVHIVPNECLEEDCGHKWYNEE